MATLSKQGTEIARFELMRKTYSFRSNGTVLGNTGEGWKLVKLKEGCTVETFRQSIVDRESRLSPQFKAYRKAVCREFPLSIRAEYLELANLLGDDIDGLWAHLDDLGKHTDLETLRELNDLRIALSESCEPVFVSL